VSVEKFLSHINANGGMSLSNHFIVAIGWPGLGNAISFACDEAQLPNTQAATGTIKGRYQGEGEINYPHTRIFTEMQLGFQCDANMSALKFLNHWYNHIFKEYYETGEDSDAGVYSWADVAKSNPLDHKLSRRQRNRTVQLSYPDKYCTNIYVHKTELGPKSSGGVRTSMTYVMERAWPYAIDAVPLQFGSAQITKVTAQFYYTKHRVVISDESMRYEDQDIGSEEFLKILNRNRKLRDVFTPNKEMNKLLGKFGDPNFSL
tara:strand:+ start:42 stop:824 length:783 start_codon:yes stop_codon:yes gene_type:complete